MTVALKITIDDKRVKAALNRVQRRAEGLRPWLLDAGEHMLGSIQRNFEEQGRPDPWTALEASTIEQKKKKGRSPLILHGQVSGGLRNSITYDADRNELRIGTNKIYGRIQQLGGEAGRGKKVTLPPRPFLLVQDEDEAHLIESLNEYVTGVW